MIFNDRNNHLLKADATMHEIESSAFLLDTDAFSRWKCIITIIHKLYWKQIIRSCSITGNQITTVNFHILLTRCCFIHLGILRQRTICVKESVVGGNIHTSTTELITDNSHNIFDFFNCIIACREYHAVRSMTCLIHLIVIDINDIHALNQCTSFRTPHRCNIFIFQGYAIAVCSLKNFIAIACVRRHSVCQNLQVTVTALIDGQLLVWKQCSHTKLCDGRENTCTRAKRNLALRFTTKLLCQRCCHFITESIWYDDKYTIIFVLYLLVIEIHLLWH